MTTKIVAMRKGLHLSQQRQYINAESVLPSHALALSNLWSELGARLA